MTTQEMFILFRSNSRLPDTIFIHIPSNTFSIYLYFSWIWSIEPLKANKQSQNERLCAIFFIITGTSNSLLKLNEAFYGNIRIRMISGGEQR